MKHVIYMYLLIMLAFGQTAFSQEAPPDCNASEAQMKAKPFTRDQGDICIKEWEQRVKDLKDRHAGLVSSIATLNQSLTSTNASIQKNNEDILALLNATQKQLEEFAQRLGVLEGKVRSIKGLNEAQLIERQEELRFLETELNKLRSERIALYPPYFNRITELARDIRSLYRSKPTKDYVVGTWADDRDCLWNIAGKAEIYNDALLWPKVWQANTEIIRNPDVIFPGQKLTLPASAPKTSDEMKAERAYWKKKRVAAQRVAAQKAAETAAPQNSGTLK